MAVVDHHARLSFAFPDLPQTQRTTVQAAKQRSSEPMPEPVPQIKESALQQEPTQKATQLSEPRSLPKSLPASLPKVLPELVQQAMSPPVVNGDKIVEKEVNGTKEVDGKLEANGVGVNGVEEQHKDKTVEIPTSQNQTCPDNSSSLAAQDPVPVTVPQANGVPKPSAEMGILGELAATSGSSGDPSVKLLLVEIYKEILTLRKERSDFEESKLKFERERRSQSVSSSSNGHTTPIQWESPSVEKKSPSPAMNGSPKPAAERPRDFHQMDLRRRALQREMSELDKKIRQQKLSIAAATTTNSARKVEPSQQAVEAAQTVKDVEQLIIEESKPQAFASGVAQVQSPKKTPTEVDVLIQQRKLQLEKIRVEKVNARLSNEKRLAALAELQKTPTPTPAPVLAPAPASAPAPAQFPVSLKRAHENVEHPPRRSPPPPVPKLCNYSGKNNKQYLDFIRLCEREFKDNLAAYPTSKHRIDFAKNHLTWMPLEAWQSCEADPGVAKIQTWPNFVEFLRLVLECPGLAKWTAIRTYQQMSLSKYGPHNSHELVAQEVEIRKHREAQKKDSLLRNARKAVGHSTPGNDSSQPRYTDLRTFLAGVAARLDQKQRESNTDHSINGLSGLAKPAKAAEPSSPASPALPSPTPARATDHGAFHPSRRSNLEYGKAENDYYSRIYGLQETPTYDKSPQESWPGESFGNHFPLEYDNLGFVEEEYQESPGRRFWSSERADQPNTANEEFMKRLRGGYEKRGRGGSGYEKAERGGGRGRGGAGAGGFSKSERGHYQKSERGSTRGSGAGVVKRIERARGGSPRGVERGARRASARGAPRGSTRGAFKSSYFASPWSI